MSVVIIVTSASCDRINRLSINCCRCLVFVIPNETARRRDRRPSCTGRPSVYPCGPRSGSRRVAIPGCSCACYDRMRRPPATESCMARPILTQRWSPACRSFGIRDRASVYHPASIICSVLISLNISRQIFDSAASFPTQCSHRSVISARVSPALIRHA
jgi:hypothetical protein